jgi:ribosomal-protein-alanine N-acetyltransferase
MSLECQFHPLGINDLAEMMAIEKSSYPQPWSASVMRDSLLSAHSRVWGIFVSNKDKELKLIGFGVITVIFDEAEILSMTIEQNYQRNGYGRKLLNFLTRKATKAGAEKVFLEVRVTNIGAISLYKSVGFKEISLRKKYYKLENNQFEDAYIFQLTS